MSNFREDQHREEREEVAREYRPDIDKAYYLASLEREDLDVNTYIRHRMDYMDRANKFHHVLKSILNTPASLEYFTSNGITKKDFEDLLEALYKIGEKFNFRAR
jgi:hypothetical protein